MVRAMTAVDLGRPVLRRKRTGGVRRVDHDRVRLLHSQKWSPQQIAVDQDCNAAYVKLIIKGAVGVHTSGLSRIAPHSIVDQAARGMPAISNPAVMEGRTLYPSKVERVGRQPPLKSGHNSAKIGKRIQKGKWKGFEVYSLTLEERATCPRSCRHWRSCYGNNSQHAIRMEHGPDLEIRIRQQVQELARQHPKGFAIRLHSLGDFYSVAYVEMWEELLRFYPQLHAFGFSARWEYNKDPIAKALIDLVGKRWSRFAIRLSNAPVEQCSTISIEHPYQKPDDAVICPQQLGKTDCCSTCAFCWQSIKRVAFINH
jgi:hypothetical protein